MPRFEETRRIGAAPTVCWRLLTEPDEIPGWLAIATDVEPLTDPGVGQRLRVRGGALGVRVELDVEVTDHQPPHRYAWRLTDPIPVDVAYELGPDVHERSSRLRVAVDADLGGRPSVRTRLAVRVLRSELSRSLDRLVRIAEGSDGAAR